jgi:site-specific DNA-cytosine methylase
MKPLSEREAIIGLRNAQLEAGHALNTRKTYRGWMLRYRALRKSRAVREYARLQGVPDSFCFEGSDRDAYRMIGNGVSVPVGEWIGREVTRYFGRRAA